MARRRGAGVTVAQSGAVQWNLRALETMPQMLGSADPVRYTQMLPGVQTGGEYQSGLHVEGCENSHNLTDIDGVCLYNVSHLLGIFGKNHCLRHVMISRVSNLVVSVNFQLLPFGEHILCSHQSL